MIRKTARFSRKAARFSRKTAFVPVLALFACGEPIVQSPEPQVETLVLSAPEEEAKTGRRIPVALRATDRGGAPVADASVSLVVIEGDASLEGLPSGESFEVTTGSDGSAEVGLTPWSGGLVSLQAFVPNLAHTGVRLDFHVTLHILLAYDIGEAYEYFGYEPGFFGGTSITAGYPVEWSCSCAHEWGVVGIWAADTVFDSGSLGAGDAFRWVAEGWGVYEYRDPFGGASAEFTVTPVVDLWWP